MNNKIMKHNIMKDKIMKHYECKYLISYSTEHLLYKDKIRFYYALKGRDGKSGMLKMTFTKYLARAVLLVNDSSTQEIEEFLKYWKCSYVIKRVYIKKEYI